MVAVFSMEFSEKRLALLFVRTRVPEPLHAMFNDSNAASTPGPSVSAFAKLEKSSRWKSLRWNVALPFPGCASMPLGSVKNDQNSPPGNGWMPGLKS